MATISFISHIWDQLAICKAPNNVHEPAWSTMHIMKQSSLLIGLTINIINMPICLKTPLQHLYVKLSQCFSFNTLPSSLIAAHKVPPVAMRSSITSARSPACTAPTCISIMSVPYSKEYSSEITSPAKPNKLLTIPELLYVTKNLLVR